MPHQVEICASSMACAPCLSIMLLSVLCTKLHNENNKNEERRKKNGILIIGKCSPLPTIIYN